MRASFLLLLAIALGSTVPVRAHEIRPAFLKLREIGPYTYDLLWQTPAQGDLRLALSVVLPPTCHNLGQARTPLVEGAVIQRWRSTCEGGLAGNPVGIENLNTSLTDVILRFAPLAGPART